MKVKFFASANIAGYQEESDVEEVPNDISEELLEDMARDFMQDSVEPSYWWIKVDDEGNRIED